MGIDRLIVAPKTFEQHEECKRQVRAALARIHNFDPRDEEAAGIWHTIENAKAFKRMTDAMKYFMGAIGVITLFLGGIGVINIMLVSVEERTREIGLRRALGARRRHIQVQFLCEALLLTLLGGAIGIVLSYLLAALIGTVPLLGQAFEDTSGKRDIHLVISPSILLLSTVVLMLVGVLSGLVPALRASRLEPVEALRYE